MAQDIIADDLNMIMNVKRVGKKEVTLKRISNFLIKILERMQKEGYLEFEIAKDEKSRKIIRVKINDKLNECRAIKPRFSVGVKEIEKYQRRYLPSRKFGKIIISTSKGLMDHHEAIANNIGGCLIAYYY